MLVLSILAGCSAGTQGESRSTLRTTTSDASTTTIKSARDQLQVGDTNVTGAGGKITLRKWDAAYRDEYTSAAVDTPAAQFEECRGDERTIAESLAGSELSLRLSTGERIDGSAGKDPYMSSRVLQPGECVVSWVTFEIPKDSIPEAVLWDYIEASTQKLASVEWVLASET